MRIDATSCFRILLRLAVAAGIAFGTAHGSSSQLLPSGNGRNAAWNRKAPDLADLRLWLATGNSKWSQDKLTGALLKLESPQRDDVLGTLAEDFQTHPAQWLPFIEQFATQWARQSPGAAMTFLGNLRCPSEAGNPEIILLESHLMKNWISRDFEAVGRYFQEMWTQPVLPTSAADQFDLMVVTAQDGPKTELNELLRWVDVQTNRPLRMAACEALVRAGKAENFESIADLLGRDLSDSRAASCASEFAVRNVMARPKEVVHWLETIAPRVRPWGWMFVTGLFHQLGRSDPRMAVKLINSGFTDRFVETNAVAAGMPLPPAEQLYDRALSEIVSGVIVQNPQYALACSQYFYNPAIRDQYDKTARRLLLSSAWQNASPMIPPPHPINQNL